MNLDVILKAQREHIDGKELILTGGGAKGDVLAQILADVLGVKLHRLDHVETATSIAAAVIAGVGVGAFQDFSVVRQFVKTDKIFCREKSIGRYMTGRKNCSSLGISVCWSIIGRMPRQSKLSKFVPKEEMEE